MDREKMALFLTDLRKKKGLSQANLAELIGVTFQAVSKWERAETIPDIAILEQLSILYGVTIDEIIQGKSNEVKPAIEECKEEGGFLKQNRSFGFWISLGFLVLYFICGFFPYLIGANYFNIIFSSNYLSGNYLLLFQLLIILCPPILTMFFYVCSNIKIFNKIYLARKIMSIAALCSIGIVLIYVIYLTLNNNYGLISLGFIILQGLILAYNILCLVLKKMKKSFLLLDYKNELTL